MSVKDWWGWREAVKDQDERITRLERDKLQKTCNHDEVRIKLHWYTPAMDPIAQMYQYVQVVCVDCEKGLENAEILKKLETWKDILCPKPSSTPTS